MRVRWIIGIVLLVSILGFAIAIAAHNSSVSNRSNLVAWPPRAGQNSKPAQWKSKNPEVIRILSLDGGGVRGLISLEVLKHIEQESGKPIAELFDFVAGTSTGSIIATKLLLADDQGKPRYSASVVAEMYTELVGEVFHLPWYHRLLTLNGLLGPKVPNGVKIDLANEVYGDTAFGDLLLPVLIPTYSITESRANIFTNWSQDSANMSLAALVTAATSPPSVFPAIRLQGDSPDAGEYIDGGVVANDPAHLALVQALDRFPNARFVIVSIGAGLRNDNITDLEAIHDGALRWLKPLLIILFDGREEYTSLMLQMVSDAQTELGLRYYRINTEVPLGHGNIEDASPENVEALKVLGQELVKKEQEKLKEAIELLQ